eukprot:gene10779-22504_t
MPGWPGRRQSQAVSNSVSQTAYFGSGENDKRYRRQHPASQQQAGLPVLILTIPNNPIQQPCALSDYNNGATLTRAGMCVHVFPSNLQFGEADGDAPV